MKLTDRSVTELLAAFRSSDPTPGGGSASALAGAVGASLLAMVSALLKAKAETDDELLRLRTAGSRAGQLAEELTTLIDRDSEAYEVVVQAYGMARATDDQKTARAERIQEAMRAAIEAPLDVMRACNEAIAHGATIADLGNPNAASDVQVGLELLGAGLRGAKANVDINLGSIKDAGYAGRVRQEVDRLTDAR